MSSPHVQTILVSISCPLSVSRGTWRTSGRCRRPGPLAPRRSAAPGSARPWWTAGPPSSARWCGRSRSSPGCRRSCRRHPDLAAAATVVAAGPDAPAGLRQARRVLAGSLRGLGGEGGGVVGQLDRVGGRAQLVGGPKLEAPHVLGGLDVLDHVPVLFSMSVNSVSRSRDS